METDVSGDLTFFKVLGAWVVLAVGWLTLSKTALIVTILFTLLQIYKTSLELIRQFRAERVAVQAAASAAATVQAIKDDPSIQTH